MKTIGSVVLALLLVSAVYAAQDVVSAVHGTIKKVDSATKTIVVKIADVELRPIRVCMGAPSSVV